MSMQLIVRNVIIQYQISSGNQYTSEAHYGLMNITGRGMSYEYVKRAIQEVTNQQLLIMALARMIMMSRR